MLSTIGTPGIRTLDELLPRELAARLDRLDVFSRKIFAGKLPGERRSKRRGRSVEFDDFREYTAGDDLRHIDWNAYARFDRLFTKLFREEEDLALHIAVDRSASMDAGEPGKVVYAHRLAMALAYIGVVNQNRVSLSVFGGRGDDGAARGSGEKFLAPVRGRTSIRRVAKLLLDSLAGGGAASDGRTRSVEEWSASLLRIARARAGRGILVLVSDFLVPPPDAAAYVPGLDALAAGGFDAYCVQVLAPGELDPGREATRGLVGDLRLTDAESGKVAEVTVSSALVARYRAAVGEYNARLRAACRARGLAHFLVSTQTPVEELILNSLRRGGLLR